MKKIAILSAVRTPVANFNGSFTNINAVKLGSLVIKAAIDRAGIDAKDIDEVIMGNVLQAGLGQNPARQAAILAGIPHETPALTINKVCGSGLKSIVLAAQSILAGDNDIVVAGGMENMSAAPFAVNKVRQGIKMGDATLVDTMVHDGLTCAMNHYHMGITAENIAKKYQISRQEQDEFALLSQQRAVNAIENHHFKNEILPIEITSKKESIFLETDEFPRKNVTLEQLSRLRPAFEKNGSVTAGNSSGINDGAAAFILMDADKAQALGLKAMAYIKSYASAGVDPQIMGMGPVPATQKALKKANLQLQDLNYIEANEAFAAQFLGVNRELKLDIDKTNIHGGAIALGHPIGASGARILTTLTHTLINQNAQYGLATLCIGGGQGIAMIIERP